MNINGMAQLLSGILESQVETGHYGAIEEERFRETLTTGPVLSDEEQSVLLLSPIARSDYKRVRREIRKDLTSRLKDQCIDMELLPWQRQPIKIR